MNFDRRMGESVMNSLAGPPRQNALSDEYMQNMSQNMAYAKPSDTNYQTQLKPQEEAQFRNWLATNQVPFDPDAPAQDYDMRGFWAGLNAGDPHAQTGMNANDGKLHYTDWWKTPYHHSFSNDSQWATPMAPHWNERDQLVMPMNGAVRFDERKQNRRK